MKVDKALSALALAAGVALITAQAATAQGMQGGPGTTQGAADQERMGRGMMQGGMNPAPAGSGMGQCMMHGGMGSEMMGQRMSRGMMMGSGMMGSGMMQSGTRSGMGKLFGSRVTPPMNLSVDDVRGYLSLQLKRLDNKRLKVGEVKSDDDKITADVVTVDDSLVQRLKVDRHTGAIEYEN